MECPQRIGGFRIVQSGDPTARRENQAAAPEARPGHAKYPAMPVNVRIKSVRSQRDEE
jgi:hypothetical protein